MEVSSVCPDRTLPAFGTVLGIDIGGSGIKGALVDVSTGALLSERAHLATPQPATPEAVAQAVRELADRFEFSGLVGCTFPAIVQHGVTRSASNVDKSWIDAPAQDILSLALERPVVLLNDADAAGLAETVFGAAKGVAGTVIVLTLGTGIGSALIVDGRLVSNTELGHLQFKGDIAEKYCSAKAKERHSLGWRTYSKRLNEYLAHLELLFSPDLFILGGGISRKHERFIPELKLRTPVLPAALRNQAGIVGAALVAAWADASH
ncbi:polyphosphate glucokinase [Formivibrio citricus]|uniref:Polyphosphate glucokinase n=1 Tax=Formivibrio citricus TaxID=83765 RepID=A0A1I5AJG6_9NEIS|nr:ROK family protein [Formivibrio citricus]SFN62585.1 polyphosphate glucokinase [Formivibrio citricus]